MESPPRRTVRDRFLAWWPHGRGLVLVGGAVVVFSVLVSVVLVRRYEAFQTFAWDLGIFNQAFYSTVTGQGFFYYTADLPSGNGGHLFVAHFSPILVALLPVYAVAPGPPTLLVLETVAAGLTAIPLYLFARVELKSEAWALLLAGVCLVSPVLLGIVWYDFHAEAFLPLGIVTTALCYRLGRWRLFLVAWFLTLAVIETAGPLLIAFGVLAVSGDYLVGRGPIRASLRKVPRTVWVALAGAVGWLLLSSLLVPYLLGVPGSSGAYSGTYAENFQILGASSIPAVFPTALLHPSAAAAALSYDATRKALYVLLLFASLGFLPLWGRLRYLLPSLIWPALAIFSNHGGYYSFGDQYAAYTLPFLMLAAISGFARVRAWYLEKSPQPAGSARPGSSSPIDRAEPSPSRAGPAWLNWSRRTRRAAFATAVAVLVVGLGVTTALTSPLNPAPIDNLAVAHGLPTETAHDQFLHNLVEMIPPGASVLTTASLFPELSNRVDAFVLPISSYFARPLTFTSVINSYVNQSDYLLYDTTTDAYGATLMEELVNYTGFGILAEGQGAVLYERGWTQPPLVWMPESFDYEGAALAESPSYDVGSLGSYGNVLYYPGGQANGTQLWGGPSVQLVPGDYRWTLTYSIVGPAGADGVRLAVEAQPLNVSIVPIDVSSAGQDFSVTESPSTLKVVLFQQNLSATPGTGPVNLTVTGSWPAPALLYFAAYSLDPQDSAYLYAVSVTQTSIA